MASSFLLIPRELPDSPILTLCLCSHCSPVQSKHIAHHPPRLIPCVVPEPQCRLSEQSMVEASLCSCITVSPCPAGPCTTSHIPRIWASQEKRKPQRKEALEYPQHKGRSTEIMTQMLVNRDTGDTDLFSSSLLLLPGIYSSPTTEESPVLSACPAALHPASLTGSRGAGGTRRASEMRCPTRSQRAGRIFQAEKEWAVPS